MAKTYRTAKGKLVDIAALLNQNESVRAVGNMNVNARGDLVDSENKKIESRNAQLQKKYRKQIRNAVEDDVVYSSKRAAQSATVESVSKKQIKASNKDVTPIETVVEETNSENNTKQTGLAAAIAKAREVKQQPLKSPRQQAKEQPGVKKI